jgi:hypothetical protein
MIQRGRGRAWVYLLLAIPFLAVLYPPLFARIRPTLVGVPFFVWYQMAWTVVAALLIGTVYLVSREPGDDVQPPRRDDEELTPP